jgi:methionyl-tRNA formyltransferase
VNQPDLPWRIVFMGTPDFAVPTLQALLGGSERVVAVVSRPDRASGRGHHTTPPPVKRIALEHHLPVYQPPTLRDSRAHTELAGFAPDLVVVAAYGQILPRSILDLPLHGCINVHASLLPRHRGAAPVQWAILAGDTMTGITVMQMNEAMDEGDILLQRGLPIEPTDTAATLGERLAHLGAATLVEALAACKAGTLEACPQDHASATLAPRIQKTMGRIDWREPADVLERKVRALQPWPTAYTSLHGRQLTAVEAHVAAAPSPPRTPGTVMASTGDGIVVQTGAGALVLDVVQLEGRRPLPAADFLRGHPVPPDTLLGT